MSNITKTVADKQSARNSASKKSKYQPKYNKPHMIIPIEDMEWKLTQKPAVRQLLDECWLSDPYGSRWMQLKTSLKRSAFMAAKKVLQDKGLFIFRPSKSIRNGRETVAWELRNLHGSRVKEFWQSTNMDLESTNMDLESTNMDLESTNMDLESMPVDSIAPETMQNQAFQKASVSSQQHLSNSSKELLRCDENLPQQTAAAPCEGVPPVDGMGDIEDFSEKVERRKKAQSRLKLMGSCGVCDFSFLQECWADLGLRIAVKIQLRKRPEWRLAVIDEQLVQFQSS
jgi:hypothetical protein